MSFTNVYYKRTAGTAKACYVCFKPTTTVLATINAVDFLYTCDGHLSDPGFATALANSGLAGPSKATVSEDEIKRVKEEWEERQRKKKEREEKEKEKAKEKDKDKDGKDADEKKSKEKDGKKPPPPMPISLPTSSTPSPPAHQKYALHRDIFRMRVDTHRKRRQTSQAKEIAPRLPSAPRGQMLNDP
ncbi:DUF1742-domain-containing protein [Rickenella mellea]|uniref:DUF1742-domain-containing protein n=1 Tax=Rickenella mellea TaxID=50990 RepID=A0A4R5XF27_9AGAM|nr:DUF1742-domain-containing protein [Rickenella mellea]